MAATAHTSAISHDAFFIGGTWQAARSEQSFTVVNPATEDVVGAAPCAGPDEIDAAVAAARVAFDSGPWHRMPIDERATHLARFADELERRCPDMGQLILAELGLVRRAAHTEPLGMTALVRYYAGLASDIVLAERRSGLSSFSPPLPDWRRGSAS